MGGSAGATSTEGAGSSFFVDLPAAQPAKIAPAAGGVAALRAYSSGKTLLYVEDMVENLRLVEHILRRRPSVRLVPAMLGGVALDLAAEHHPDMILLDLHLPDMSGEEVLRRLQADPATRSTPVVVLSADIDQNRISRLLETGSEAYLTKPIGVQPFLQTLDDLLGAPPGTGRAPAAAIRARASQASAASTTAKGPRITGDAGPGWPGSAEVRHFYGHLPDAVVFILSRPCPRATP